RHLPGSRALCPQILAVGLPAAAAVMFNVLVNGSMFKVMSKYGDISVAAMGIVKKIDMIPLNIALGLGQGILPLAAYNYASHDYPRMKNVSRFARIAATAFAALCIIVFELFSEPLVRFFIDEDATVALGAQFLRIACLGTVPMTLFFLFNTTFQAMGKGKQSFLLVFVRQIVLNLSILFAFEALFGRIGIVWTQPVGDLLAAGIAWILFERVVRKLNLEQTAFERRSA
ncbi:MAG TPA: hypothetical protein DCR44_04680, partial [Acholeplasmatales bacterium]|nr:hypothetical protein [Acholeplasmatales bacterium]